MGKPINDRLLKKKEAVAILRKRLAAILPDKRRAKEQNELRRRLSELGADPLQ